MREATFLPRSQTALPAPLPIGTLKGIEETETRPLYARISPGLRALIVVTIMAATLMEVFPPNRRGIAQAIFGLGVAVAPTLGPTLGGYLTDNFSWPWIFFVNRVDTRLLIGIGAAFTALAMFRFHAILTLTTPDESYFLPLTLRGIGVGLQIVPLSVVALGTLRPQQLAEGAGLYNLFRQLGGSFGIAMLTTLISRRNQLHYARLGEHLNIYDPFQRQQLAHIQSLLVQRGMTPYDAQAGALKVLANLVQRQAAVLTFMDVYAVLAWVGVGTLLLLVFFQRPRSGKPSAEAH